MFSTNHFLHIVIFMVILLVMTRTTPTPPILNPSFQVRFQETHTNDQQITKINGFWFYDIRKNRERTDWTNGRFNQICSSILPNISTACTSLAVNTKRYIIFAQKAQCCYCCDYAHGCGPLLPDWLLNAQYVNRQLIDDNLYDKWSVDGMTIKKEVWVTADTNKTLRRIKHNPTHITDYLINSYINRTIPDPVFSIPSYCKNPCPSTSKCGQLRKKQSIFIRNS